MVEQPIRAVSNRVAARRPCWDRKTSAALLAEPLLTEPLLTAPVQRSSTGPPLTPPQSVEKAAWARLQPLPCPAASSPAAARRLCSDRQAEQARAWLALPAMAVAVAVAAPKWSPAALTAMEVLQPRSRRQQAGRQAARQQPG